VKKRNIVITKQAMQMLDEPLQVLNLPVRIANALEGDTESGNPIRASTVRELLQMTRQQLFSVPNFGPKTLQTILRCLSQLGFGEDNSLADDSQDDRRENAKRLGLDLSNLDGG